jgi:hypothetical protein
MKRASRRKTASKAKKKAAPNKKKAAPKKAASKLKLTGKATLGCCTLMGNGPNQQIERITQADCKQRAIAAGRNYQWVAGDCAQPS